MPTPEPEKHKQQSGSTVLIAIALGALVGTTARASISHAIPGIGPSAFPLGTLLVNLIGCLLIGVAQTVFRINKVRHARLLQPGVTIGLLGGFTTFSTFSVETIRLLQTGFGLHALAYQSFSVIGGLGAVVLGAVIGRWMSHHWFRAARR